LASLNARDGRGQPPPMSQTNSSTPPGRCDTTAWITLRRTRGSRYYRVHLEHDLWDAWLLTGLAYIPKNPRGCHRRRTAVSGGGRVDRKTTRSWPASRGILARIRSAADL
jgi:hypothetical protein